MGSPQAAGGDDTAAGHGAAAGGRGRRERSEACPARRAPLARGQVFLMGAVQSINVEPGLPIELDDDPPGLISE